MRKLQRIILFIFLTGFSACGGDASDKPESRIPDAPKAEDATLNLSIKRFEQDLFALEKGDFSRDTAALFKKYGDFPELFTSRIIRVGSRQNPLFKQNISGFLNDPDIRSVYAEVQKQYAQVDFLQKGISEALGRYHRVFPDSVIPQVLTMVSGFNYNVVVADSTLGIGLDMYLGAKSQFYEWLALPLFKTRNMHRDMMVPDAVRAFVTANHEMQNPSEELIGAMVYHGKVIYFCQQLLPETDARMFLGYTPEEMAWCKANEGQIWAHFVDRKLFYSTDFNDQVKYINDGPFTPGFPKEAPAKAGVWLGWQIVLHYMERHPDMDLAALMAMQDARGLFKDSGYKPLRK